MFTFSYAIPRKRYRRQSVSHSGWNLPYGGWSGGSSNPSGGSPGAYYGTGNNPNQGNFAANINDADSNIHAINYGQGYYYNGGQNLNWNQQQQQQQQQQYNLYNNNHNNAPQRPNTNNYFNRPYNRYSPGSQGWYATGGNYWYNNGQPVIPHSWLLITGILIPIIFI
ncbi:unnamed protein product [Rotaria sp. Silwood2]|nr:unnamed protein product [Rotaria sp. Silwood2]